MSERIQRVPRGLIDLLSVQGFGPQTLGQEIVPVVAVEQMLGIMQVQFPSTSNAALAEAGNLDIVIPNNQYWVLFGMAMLIAKTATMTALRAAVGTGNGSATTMHVSEELGPFGATETGAVRVCFVSPYPRILPPGSFIRGILEILGTDATANCALTAQVGVLG